YDVVPEDIADMQLGQQSSHEHLGGQLPRQRLDRFGWVTGGHHQKQSLHVVTPLLEPHPTGSLGVQELLRPYPPAVLSHKNGTVRRFYDADARRSPEGANLTQEQTDVGHHLGVLPPPGPPALPRLTPPAKAGH